MENDAEDGLEYTRAPEASGHSADVQKAVVRAIRRLEAILGDDIEVYLFKRAQGAEYWDRLGVPAKPEGAKTIEEVRYKLPISGLTATAAGSMYTCRLSQRDRTLGLSQWISRLR